jgi:hypothetical protein
LSSVCHHSSKPLLHFDPVRRALVATGDGVPRPKNSQPPTLSPRVQRVRATRRGMVVSNER